MTYHNMKQVISIILILVSLNSFGQYKRNLDNKDIYVSLAIMTSSVILGGVGDGFNDNGMKPLGHSLNALSIVPLLIAPFVLDISDYKWASYILSYTFIRFALYDAGYNITRGLPLAYLGNSSLYDRALRSTKSPDSWIIGMKSLSLVVGFSIPIRYY